MNCPPHCLVIIILLIVVVMLLIVAITLLIIAIALLIVKAPSCLKVRLAQLVLRRVLIERSLWEMPKTLRRK